MANKFVAFFEANVDGITEKLAQFKDTVINVDVSGREKLAEVNQDLTSMIGKVAKITLISKAVQTMISAVQEGINTVKEFDVAFTELAKVSNYSGEALKEYTRTLGELGEAVGRTTKFLWSDV